MTLGSLSRHFEAPKAGFKLFSWSVIQFNQNIINDLVWPDPEGEAGG